MLTARDELREDVGRIPEQGDRQRRAPPPRPHERGRCASSSESPARRRSASRAAGRSTAGRPRRRGSPHPPSSRRAAGRRPCPPSPAVRTVRPDEVGGAEVHLARRAERLVGPLQDPLGADVDPRAGGHLPEHRQPLGLEPAELVPGRPLRHEQRVRDQHARSTLVRAEHADRLPRLDEQRLVVAKPQQRLRRCPAAPRATAQPGPSRRRRRAPPGARRPPDRGC